MSDYVVTTLRFAMQIRLPTQLTVGASTKSGSAGDRQDEGVERQGEDRTWKSPA